MYFPTGCGILKLSTKSGGTEHGIQFQRVSIPTPKTKEDKNGKGIAITVVIVICAIALGITALGSFYTIGEQENAVVTTFGVPQTVTSPGLHFKIPYAQQVRKVDMTIWEPSSTGISMPSAMTFTPMNPSRKRV